MGIYFVLLVMLVNIGINVQIGIITKDLQDKGVYVNKWNLNRTIKESKDEYYIKDLQKLKQLFKWNLGFFLLFIIIAYLQLSGRI